LIAAHWFRPAAAVYLGAANLAGYLIGAIAARRVGLLAGTGATLRAAMALTAASLLACAMPLGFAWYFLWRLVSGMTGGAAMALAAPTVLPHLPPARRAVAGGAIFTGVGLGIAASGTLVPALIRWGIPATWLGLAALAAILTALSWRGWPEAGPPPTAPPPGRGATRAIRALYAEYALNAVGLVPHMVFLVDFIARGLDRGLAAGALAWVVFGLGAVVGPLAGGHVGGRIGFRAALCGSYVVEAAAVALPLATHAAPALWLSSFVVGAFVPGCVALTIGRTHELLPADPPAQAAAWGWCTVAFAVGQAAAGYGFSYIFARPEGGYPALFALGAAALLVALLLDLAVTPPGRRGRA
jgi:predicted MFS family arabinose efflux permease